MNFNQAVLGLYEEPHQMEIGNVDKIRGVLKTMATVDQPVSPTLADTDVCGGCGLEVWVSRSTRQQITRQTGSMEGILILCNRCPMPQGTLRDPDLRCRREIVGMGVPSDKIDALLALLKKAIKRQ